MCCKIAKTAAFIVAALLQLLVNGPVHCDADAMWCAAHCFCSGCCRKVLLVELGHHPVSAGWSRVGCSTTPAHLMASYGMRGCQLALEDGDTKQQVPRLRLRRAFLGHHRRTGLARCGHGSGPCPPLVPQGVDTVEVASRQHTLQLRQVSFVEGAGAEDGSHGCLDGSFIGAACFGITD